MRVTARVRALPGVLAGLVLAIPGGVCALTVQDASITPGLVVPLGTVVTITATVVNDTGQLGSLYGCESMVTLGCGVCIGSDGMYAMYAGDPMILTNPDAITPNLNFTHGPGGETAVVVWAFTATRTGAVSLSLVAHDDVTGVSEGCGNPAPLYGCGLYNPLPTNALTCSFLSLTVTATLTGRTNASVTAPTPRPANTAYPDDTITVVMSVTNTGATLITLNAGVSSTRPDSTALVTPAGAPGFPVGVTAGSAAFLTWTYSVTGAAQPGASAVFATDVERTLGLAAPIAIAAPPLTISATLLLDPDGALPTWSTVYAGSSYYMLNDEIWVVATIANLGGSSLDVDPVVVLPDTYGGNGVPDVVPTAPRAPAGVQVLGSLTSRIFTWKYRVNRDDVYQFCFDPAQAFPAPGMEFRVRSRGLEAVNQLEILKDAVAISGGAPSTVTVGFPFSVTLWLSNQTGRAIELDASATVFLTSDDPLKAVIASGPTPTGSRVFAPGQSLPYVFTVNALALGSAPLRGGILFPGGATPAGPCMATPSQFYVEIVAPSPLDIAITPSATLVNAGTAYGLTLVVSNSTTCPAELDSLGPVLEYPYNASFISQLSTDCGSYPCAVPALGSVTIRFTVTPNECGEVDWAGTETGRWSGCGNAPFSGPFHSPRIHVRRAGALMDGASLAWAVSKTSVVEGQLFNVVATVIPAGENDLTGFTIAPTIHLSSTGTAISSQAIPSVPGTLPGCGACVTNICPGKAASFTWTFMADAKGWSGGKVWFTFTATGQDPYDGQVTSSATTTGMVSILRPSALLINGLVPGEGTVFVDSAGSSGILNGCQVPVVACFEVDGDTDISTTTFLPGAGMTPAPAGLAVLSGSPDLPALLVPGEHCFTWTFSPVGAGTVNFTASAVGTEVTWGRTAYAKATTVGGATLTPAALSASALINASVLTTAAGQTVNVILVVSNAGHVPITGLSATVMVTGATCGARPPLDPRITAVTAPDTVTPVGGCGDDRVFQWTFTATVTGAGIVNFSITVTGQDVETSAPLTLGRYTTCLTILPRPPLYVTLVAGSSTIVQGADLNVTVRLDNQGATALNVVPGSQILAANTADLIPVPPPPPGPVTVAAYTTSDVLARISAKGSAATGPVQITLTPTAFTAYDLGVKGAPSVPVSVSGSLTVTVVPPSGPVVPGVTIGDNPWHPAAGPLRLTWGEPAGGDVLLRVLTLNGETVKTLLTGPAPGAAGEILWDGSNESGQKLAAGIYLLRWESAGKKQTRKLAVVK